MSDFAEQGISAVQVQLLGMESLLLAIWCKMMSKMSSDVETQTTSPAEVEQQLEKDFDFPQLHDEELSCGTNNVIRVNESIVDKDQEFDDLRLYRRVVCSKLKGVQTSKGRKLVSTNRAASQILLVRSIVFINRPAAYVNHRWPAVRVIFKDMKQLGEYVSLHRFMIDDFYQATMHGVSSDGAVPRLRFENEMTARYQRRNILMQWAGQLNFDS